MTTAMAGFNPIKDRCMKQSEGKVQACASCVDTKCEARSVEPLFYFIHCAGKNYVEYRLQLRDSWLP